MMGTVDPRYDDMVKTFEETPVGGKPSNADIGGKNVG